MSEDHYSDYFESEDYELGTGRLSPEFIEQARFATEDWIEKDFTNAPLKSEPAPPSIGIATIKANGGVPTIFNDALRGAIQPAKAADSWRQELESQGVLFIHPDYLARDLHASLQWLGFELLYSETRTCFLIRNPHLARWVEWQEIRPDKEGIEPLARAKNLMSMMVGHLVPAGQKYVKVKPIQAGAWGKGSELYGNLISLRGEMIPCVNEYERWVDDRFEFIDSLTDAQRAELVGSLDSIFENMPGVAPLAEDDAALARHAGRYVMTMMAHRVIQDHPDFKAGGGGKHAREIRPQREVPIIAGEPDLGKSTIWEMLLPRVNLFRKGKMKFSGDANLMGRACAGNILMIANEMSKLRANSPAIDVIKGYITEPTITFDEKYERNKTISMPSVFVSTANEIKLPNDKALRSRFVIFRLGVDPFLPEDHPFRVCSETRGRAIADYIAEHRHDWLNAGLYLARANTPIQCPKSFTLMRERIARATGDEHESDLIDVLEEMIRSGEWRAVSRNGTPGKPAITGAELAWQAGALTWPRAIKDPAGMVVAQLGSLIEPDQGWLLTHADLTAAYANARRRSPDLLDRIRGAFAGVGWVGKRNGGVSASCRKRFPLGADGEIRVTKCYLPGASE